MPKVKYHYDPKTLSYLPIENSTPLRISNFLLFLLSSAIFGAVLLFGLINTRWLNTPTEIVQERELKNYELQFDILNRRLAQIESVLENVHQTGRQGQLGHRCAAIRSRPDWLCRARCHRICYNPVDHSPAHRHRHGHRKTVESRHFRQEPEVLFRLFPDRHRHLGAPSLNPRGFR